MHRPPGEGAGNCAVGAVGTSSRVSPLWTLQCRASEPDQMLRQRMADRGENRDPGGNTQLLTVEPRLENAPLQARENVGIVVARGRMLSSVRPSMRQEDSRRPVWEFADWIQITWACSKHCGITWLSQSRLADCCAIRSFRSPPTPSSSWLGRCDRRSVDAAFDQQSPDDTGGLVGQRHGD